MADQRVDVTVVLGFLYLGSKKTARNKAWVRQNVRYVLNCTPTRDADPVAGVANYWEKDGLAKYLRLAVFDSAGEELKEHVDRACAFIEEARYHGGVLVHCNKGVSRSVAIVVAYLMKARGLSLEEALGTVKRKRPQAAPNAGFLRQLQRLDREYAQQRAAKAGTSAQRRKRGRVGPVAGPALPQGASKRRAAIGPSLPPAGRPGGDADAATPIGPPLPPSADQAPAAAAEPPSAAPGKARKDAAVEDGTSRAGGDESAPPSRTAIGPGLPPWMQPPATAGEGRGGSESVGGDAGRTRTASPAEASRDA